MNRNPYKVALTVGAAGGWAGAVVLALVAAAEANKFSPSLDLVAGAGAWSNIFLLVAIAATAGALVVAAVTWRPDAVDEERQTD
jgi:hypothetical protein